VSSASTIPTLKVKIVATTSPLMREPIKDPAFSTNHINADTDTIDIATSQARPLKHRI
jgi:hypothetical protein